MAQLVFSPVSPYRSFIFRYRLPPLRLRASASGRGSGLTILAGGGSCHFSICDGARGGVGSV